MCEKLLYNYVYQVQHIPLTGSSPFNHNAKTPTFAIIPEGGYQKSLEIEELPKSPT